MSAINDALRRASSAAKSSPSASPLAPMPVEPPPKEAPPQPPPMPPVAAPPPPIAQMPRAPLAAPPPLLRPQPEKKGSKLVWVLVILVVLGLGGAGGFYFWKKQHSNLAKNGKNEAEEVTDNDRLAAIFGDEKAAGRIARTDSHDPAPAKPPPAARTPDHPKPVPVSVTIAPTTTPAPAPAPAVPRPPARFPPLRLQSIFYRPASPSVIINGKTLYVTDEINGVTVADIQPASVTLVLSGQTNILTLR